MRFGAGLAHDIKHFNTARQQGITDERAVAAPRYGLGAHNGNNLLPGSFDKTIYRFGEFARLHIIGVIAKRCILPAQVDRIINFWPETAQAFYVGVGNAANRQTFLQCGLLVLRVMPRTRHGAHVDKFVDTVFF